MKIVIDISDEKYKVIQDGNYGGVLDNGLYYAIKNGTPLPKGHGRLIDADAATEIMLNQMPGTGYQSRAMYVLESQMYTPTIIEADKEGEQE